MSLTAHQALGAQVRGELGSAALLQARPIQLHWPPPPACRLARQARRLRRLFWVVAVGVSLSACTPLSFLAANTAAAFSHFSKQANLAYGPATTNKLDVYLPTRPGHRPIVVFFYGGGWDSGDKASYKFAGAALADAGIIAVLPNYTLYPQGKFPTFMQDAAQAVAWTRAHARAWGGDPDQLYLLGHSAGAHIAVLLALDQEYLQQVGGSSHWLRGVVGLSGPYDFLPFKEAYLNDLFGPPQAFANSQPINFVRADAPPLLLMHGTRDSRVNIKNTRNLAAALQAVGGSVSTRYFERASHEDLVAALSIPARNRLPVLKEIKTFIARLSGDVDIFAGKLPIDQAFEHSVNVVGAPVLKVEVVGVLPDINRK